MVDDLRGKEDPRIVERVQLRRDLMPGVAASVAYLADAGIANYEVEATDIEGDLVDIAISGIPGQMDPIREITSLLNSGNRTSGNRIQQLGELSRSVSDRLLAIAEAHTHPVVRQVLQTQKDDLDQIARGSSRTIDSPQLGD